MPSPWTQQPELRPAGETTDQPAERGTKAGADSGPLPFKPGEGAAPPPSAIDELDLESSGLGATTGLSGLISPLAGMVLPFGAKAAPQPPPRAPAAEPAAEPPAAAPAPFPELTVQQYASLCATCEVYPDLIRETNEKYGVADERSRRALDELWQGRLRADARLGRQYYEAFAQYRDWLKQQG